MKWKIDILRIVVNCVCFLVAGLIVLLLALAGIFDNIAHAVPMYIGLVLLLGGVPAIMAAGNRMIKKQDDIISLQVHFNQPKSFNKRSVILGYVLMFLPLYVFLTATILIPHGIFVAFFIPISVMTFMIIRMKRAMLDTFNISRKKYGLIHTISFIFSIILGFILRSTVVIPLFEKYM